MTESKSRLEAFSDGVFAIAITLLILEIKVPHADHGLWAGIIALWPSYIAFVMSFVVVLIMWVSHHQMLGLINRVNYRLLFVNGLLLLTVTFVPFPTAVLAEHLSTPEAKPAVAFYCATFVVNGLVWNLLSETITRTGLLRSDIKASTIAEGRKANRLGLIVYLVATALAFVQPWLGLLLNVSLWALWIRLAYRQHL
ncbi:MAG TPA: TMEM175 family protein [Gemmatimonadales bacterium]|nr:TMEM175 family protein [Gemmatimonadales bacterium]